MPIGCFRVLIAVANGASPYWLAFIQEMQNCRVYWILLKAPVSLILYTTVLTLTVAAGDNRE